MGASTLLWFRRDLRLADNPALQAALDLGGPVVPLFVLDESGATRPPGAASLWWLDKSLRALAADLEARGSRLILRRGPAEAVVRDVAAEVGAGTVVWNRLYEQDAVERDARLKADLGARSCNAALLNEPWTVKTAAGAPFKVFTPYWRAARTRLDLDEAPPIPPRLPSPQAWPASDDLDAWGLHPRRPDWSGGFADWRPGEAGAAERLEAFLFEALADYPTARDRPAVEGTSRLSPHLAWGEIGPRQIARRLLAAGAHAGHEAQAEKVLAELGWREFNIQLLFHWPRLATENFKPSFDALPWRHDPEGLAAWRAGRTGYPLVDAGMRQLWAAGWMHNRVRMVAASFLIKHLLIDWREGERWFWDTLVDADPANNAANWQWVAGSGADASPFFRIFNPTAQGERFDPDGDYVRRWVPELAGVPARDIHQPWRIGGVRGYPAPIVDHDAARRRALDALKATRADP